VCHKKSNETRKTGIKARAPLSLKDQSSLLKLLIEYQNIIKEPNLSGKRMAEARTPEQPIKTITS